MMDTDALRAKYLAATAAAEDEAALEAVRLAALGKKGEISALMATLGKMEPEARKTAGAALNVLRDEIDAALRAKKAALADAALDARLQGEWLDVTLPARPRPTGSIHPVTQVTEELTTIFADMGFAVAEGPQVETDWYNFDALNLPPAPPARRDPDAGLRRRGSGDGRRRRPGRWHRRRVHSHAPPTAVRAPAR